jgi:hypothetical protein
MFHRGLILSALAPVLQKIPLRLASKSGVSLAVLFFAVVLIPTAGLANTTKNCPPEPAQNVPIASGQTYSGSNCILKTTGDVDSFTFTAAAGNTWRIVEGLAGSVAENICLNVYAPGSTGTPIFTGCTGVGFGGPPAVEDNQVTASAGVYTIVVTEGGNGNQLYDLSLERIDPPPGDAIALTLAQSVTGTVAQPTAQNPYTFYAATTGTYEVVTSYVSGADNVCFDIFQPGAISVSTACTGVGFGGPSTIQATFTPAKNGTYLVVIHTASNDSTTNYNLEVSCILGGCPNLPKCALTDTLSYDAPSGTLTMNFTLGTPVAATWNVWLTSQNTMSNLWSVAQPITEPPVSIPKTQTGVAKAGKIGVLSTLTTPKGGITCSNFAQVNTGAP